MEKTRSFAGQHVRIGSGAGSDFAVRAGSGPPFPARMAACGSRKTLCRWICRHGCIRIRTGYSETAGASGASDSGPDRRLLYHPIGAFMRAGQQSMYLWNMAFTPVGSSFRRCSDGSGSVPQKETIQTQTSLRAMPFGNKVLQRIATIAMELVTNLIRKVLIALNKLQKITNSN